jgi:hypothetical protein
LVSKEISPPIAFDFRPFFCTLRIGLHHEIAMIIILALYILVGLLLVGLSLPLIYRIVPPNYWYGFRVRRTLKSKEVWYPANEYAARRLLWVGIATVVAAVTLFPLLTDISVYATALVSVLLVGLALSVIQSLLFLRTLPSDNDHPTRRE